MKNGKRPNLKIVGDSSAAGGSYDDAKLVGNGTVNGDLDCLSFKSIGDSKINGKLKADSLKVVGSIAVTGSIRSDNAVITGDLKADGDVNSQLLVIRGSVDTRGGVKGEQLSLRGYIGIKRSCEAETIRLDGQVTIDGLVNADDVDIRAYGPSKIGEIGGNRIVVRKGSGSSLGKMMKSLFLPSGFRNGVLAANSIEGDDVRLSYTRAKVVRGKNVIIENGCDIDLVEYKDNLRVHRSASVREKKKV